MKEENLISSAGFEQAAKEFESTQAEFKGAFEEVKFNFKTRLMQAQRQMRINDTAWQNAKRRLFILGLNDAQVEALATEKSDKIALYELRAPFDERFSKSISPPENASTKAKTVSSWPISPRSGST